MAEQPKHNQSRKAFEPMDFPKSVRNYFSQKKAQEALCRADSKVSSM